MYFFSCPTCFLPGSWLQCNTNDSITRSPPIKSAVSPLTLDTWNGAISLILSSHPPGDTFTWLSEEDILFFCYTHTQRPDLLEMAHLPYRCHGNFPQRRATLLPQMEEESNHSCNGKTGKASSSSKRQRPPGKDVAALLKRISIHPEAQRILGNSCIPVVSLERLNFQSVSLSASLQPVVSLVRLPCQTHAKRHNSASCLDHSQQNGFNQNEANVLEISEASPQSKPAESSDLNQPDSTPTSWTEPYCPDSASSGEPEQDSGFDCESNPDQPYILFDSGTDEWDPDGKTDSEMFYLDPDPEETIVIELDPEPEADLDRSLEQEDESESKYEADIVQVDNSEDQNPDLCCSQEEGDSFIPQPEPGPGTEQTESEDFCAVCLNGGDLLCCDRCPKVYHLACHIPALISFPLGDWVCTLCRTYQEPIESYDCEDLHSCGGVKAPYTLSNQDQRRCEKLTLLLYCHALSAPFHEPVSPLARNYYQIIKRPINLSVIRRKLDKSNTLHYFTAEQFVDDVLLMFKNCATFNYPDSEVAQAGRNMEVFFLSKLKEIFPERTFPSASQDTMNRVRLQWLSRKKKENYRKKRNVFSGKKYYL
ncbi:E3 ubiquitin-protein ligase TRIM33-like isoform X3 [Dicentrarchus labrax]|uniref:E3 ubiquitin-protein ligase TRIM33-like isoform X3 n=1 Tax=Dicentrarchus labrax TaxID=13489 RepID=UPI0021F57338|nr:E3 ubiquitin-protein ligase TRIM33-like isoform X3 [Dicentrarchus labrax]